MSEKYLFFDHHILFLSLFTNPIATSPPYLVNAKKKWVWKNEDKTNQRPLKGNSRMPKKAADKKFKNTK